MDRQCLREQLDQLLSMKKADEAERLLKENRETAESANDLLRIYDLVPVCEAEREAGQPTVFSKVSGLDELLERDRMVKFYVRRIAFDILDDEGEFFRFCVQNRVSLSELFIVTYCNAIYRDKVREYLTEKIVEGKLAI